MNGEYDRLRQLLLEQERGRMDARILACVEAREVEPERRDAPLQAAHGEPARMRAGVRAQA